jgi:anti-sigma factor RsiW
MTSRDRIPDHPEELMLLDYLVGQLTPEASHEIQRHVASCRACRRTIADLSMTVDELDRLPTFAIPHDSPPGLMRPRPRPQRPLRRLLPLVAVLLAATITVLAISLGRSMQRSPPAPRSMWISTPTGATQQVIASYLGRLPATIVALHGAAWLVIVKDRDLTGALRALRRHTGTDSRVWVGSMGDTELPPGA